LQSWTFVTLISAFDVMPKLTAAWVTAFSLA
jgi:hypothetical protein